MAPPSRTGTRLSTLRIVSIYVFFAGVYILLSDRILRALTADAAWAADIQSVKGMAFVAVTAGLLYWMINRYCRSLMATQAQEREATHRLQLEQAKLASIIDSMGDGLVVVSRTGALERINPSTAAMFGVCGTPPPLLEWPAHFSMYDDSAETPLAPDDQPIMRALRGEAVVGQRVYLGGDGPARWLVMSARPILDAGGAVDGAVAVIRDSTQSVQTNQALRESQRRLLTLLGNLPGMAYRCHNDRLWTMEFVSEGVEALTGYTWVELTSNQPSYAEIIYPDDRDTVWETVQRAIDARQPFRMIYRITTRDGEMRWVWEQGQGVYDDSGTMRAVEGFISDITAHKLAEDQLAESEKRFRSLIENASDVITLLDHRGVVVYQSPAANRVLGYASDTMVGKPGIEFVHPDDRSRVRDVFRSAIENPAQAWPLEFRMRHADGSWRFVESANQVYANDSPDPIVVCNIRDVTARKEAESQGRRLATAVEQAADAILICNLDGGIDYANGAALTTTQYAGDEIVAHSIRQLVVQGADRSEDTGTGEAYAAFESALHDGATWQGRLTARRKSGETFPCDVAVSPVRDDDRALLHSVIVMRDVTREVRIEAQVRQQQKLEAIGTLAGGIAHDFNNILSAILGYAEMATLGLVDNPDSVAHDLEQVMKAGQRARELVKQILTFSRKTEIGRAPVKTDLVLNEALQLLRATLPSNIQVHASIATECDPVLIDPTHLHQVVMNLCINSYHAMREHGGTLSITSSQVTVDETMAVNYLDLAPGEYVKIAVRDTGHGMDRVVMEHIFEPFFTTKGEHEGTGLGLSTAYGVVKEAGGSILVYSEKDRGTTMHVYLPAQRVGVQNEASATVHADGGNGECIMIIDDEPAIAMVAAKMLERLGYAADFYTDSRKALAKFLENPEAYDAIVTDYSMPELSGLQVAAAARERRPDMPIVLTSGFHEAFQRHDPSDLPIDDVIAKPFDYQSLSAGLHRALRRPRAAAPSNPPSAPTPEGVPSEMR